MKISLTLLAGASLGWLAPIAAMADKPATTADLLKLSLKELSEVEVTSVSKYAEKASEAAAAVYVITQEDIHRSGAQSIPDALRLAPGVSVARAGTNQWAVSVRGFNDQFSNKLLVLMDGRTIYTPLFAGVYWDMQDVVMGDIDRIEVIRGPGATLWGANAVNGVINIISKKAQDTQGGLISASVGNFNRNRAEVRYGGKTENAAYRVYAQQVGRDESYKMNNLGADDAANSSHAGFRVDTENLEKNTLTLQGDTFYGVNDISLALPINSAPFITAINGSEQIAGSNILGRWAHKLEKDSEVTAQLYYDFAHRSNYVYEWSQSTLDLDIQHTFKWGERHETIWGGGYRNVWDNFDGGFYVNFTPSSKTYDQFNFFAQDKYALIPHTLFLTIGSKFEHNDFTGFEYQPSARLAWLVDERQTLWAAISRALRTPSRSLHGLSLISGTSGATYLRLFTNPGLSSEEAKAYEVGYRIKPTKSTDVDVTAYYNDYDSLVNIRQGTPGLETGLGFPPRIVVPFLSDNTSHGNTYGGELSTTWQTNEYLRLTANYSLLHMNLKGSSLINTNTKSPQQQASFRAYWQLTDSMQWDNLFYYVDEIQPTSTISVADYLRWDTRLAWKAMDGLELTLVGQNLLDDRHAEFSGFLFNNQVQIPRSVYAGATLRF